MVVKESANVSKDIHRNQYMLNFPDIIDNKLKINSFILPRDLVKKMEDLVEKSLNKDKEMAFNLCKIDNELKDDIERIGTEREIQTIRNCTKGKYAGQFHTHPPNGGGRSDLSFNDLANAYSDGIGCIGGTLDGLIYCHVRKGEVKLEGMEKIVSGFTKFEKKLLPDKGLRHKDKLEYTKTIKNLQNDLFKTFLISELYEDED